MWGLKFLSKKQKSAQPPVEVDANLLTVAVVARLNVRTNPDDRAHFFGDPLDAVLAAKSLGEVASGGIMFDVDTGHIDYVDLEIGLQDSTDETFATIIDTLEKLGAPKGSFLDILAEKRKIPFGRFEGMSVSFTKDTFNNPNDPSDEINALLSLLEPAFGELGSFRGYWEGEDACELYFYGPSFDALRAKIQELVPLHADLASCGITQIA